ncbi:vascular endothelial growth factor receptor 1 isoform X2 [Ischnura elegans]|uniref:vascular endothelial growth factor receptor 1 isoform X2 n=1 Tax=Ischnura elegans TaxID=197161 RepID=UPI001ED88C3F|nr:vascular endothelial growth factor receptor 1 isoform X2 [Ischnura elegans]
MGGFSPRRGRGSILVAFVICSCLAITKAEDVNEDGRAFVKFKPPRIIPDKEELVFNTGDKIQLKCEGNRPINWSIPLYSSEYYKDDLAQISVNFSRNIGAEYSFISHLSVNHSVPEDTGYYYCHYQQTDDMEAVEEVDKIYVYVNDTKELLVNTEDPMQGFAMQTQYEPAIIPCRPTSPDVNVTLFKDGEMVPYESDFITFDPHRGYVFESVRKKDAGYYECWGVRGQKKQSKTFNWSVFPQTDKVPKPKIDEKSTRHVVLGTSAHFVCKVQMDIGITFLMDWKIPNPSGFNDGRVIKGNATSSRIFHNSVEYKIGLIDLLINNVTDDDEGYYECIVQDHSYKTNSDKQFVQVHKPDAKYINFTVQGSNEIIVNHGDPVAQWVVNVAAHPPPQLIWYDPRGKEISVTSTKYEIKTDPTFTMLKISEIMVQDAGIYQLKGINEEKEETVNLTLTVHDKPTVVMDESKTKLFYMYGENHTIKCDVVGYPVPNITWYFRSCGNKYPNCDEHEIALEKKYYEEFHLEDGGRKSSTLKIEALDSGFLTCLACNEVGCENETINFFVTDIMDGFNAMVNPPRPVEGDDVELQCGASTFNYTDIISWFKYNPDRNDSKMIEDGSRYKIVKSRTGYSYRVNVVIPNITMDYSGNYTCTVRKISDDLNDYEDMTVAMDVRKIQAPIFNGSNMNGSHYYVGSPHGAEFKCTVSGVPTPIITWYKDGEIYDVTKNNNRIEFSDDRQTLKIKFVSVEDEGKYSCEAKNKAGIIEGYRTLELKDKTGVSAGLWIGLVLGTTFLCLIILYLFINNRKEQKLRKELMLTGLANFEEGALESINPELGVDDQAELLPYDKKWEFPREKLKLGKQLGSGAFGVVMKADACGIIEGEAVTTVAVKMVKRNADYMHIKALASELKIMVHLGKHLNVVNLLGACTKNLTKRELLVIVEYCRFGNLQNYLLRHREDFINQIDPDTGKVDPQRGLESDGQGAGSLCKGQGPGKADSRIKYAALSFSTSASSQGSQGSQTKDGSVQDYRAAPVVKIDDSACNGVSGHIINTDMSFVSMSPSAGDECGVTGGSGTEPEWRTNYRGDYGRRDVRPICTSDLICWAFQVARGIDYLASRKVLHGDLAARNILLAEDNIVKICDFGLAKSMYNSDNYKKKGDGPLPIKWMAIESIRDRVFSTQSDVWSFGIVLWEFFSLARTPYPGMEADERLYNKLVAGYRMEKPQYATDDIYNTMCDCWKAKPNERPSFTELTDILGGMLEDAVKRHYIDLNSPYMSMNDQAKQATDYLGMMSEPSYANAIRETTPQRDYVNVPTKPENPEDYMTMSSPVPPSEDGGESESGYLCMRSASMGSGGNPSVIFSPRPIPPQTFTFDVPSPRTQSKLAPRIRPVETKGAEGPELSPMLPDGRVSKEGSPSLGAVPQQHVLRKEDSLDSGMGSPNSYFNPTYRSLPNTNGHLPPNMEVNEAGYVNMPQSKEISAKAARQSDRSSGFQSEVEEGSPVASSKNVSPYEVPIQIVT